MARDIVSRGLDESLAYARAQRVGRAIVVGGPRERAGELLLIDLAAGRERTMNVDAALEHPERLDG